MIYFHKRTSNEKYYKKKMNIKLLYKREKEMTKGTQKKFHEIKKANIGMCLVSNNSNM